MEEPNLLDYIEQQKAAEAAALLSKKDLNATHDIKARVHRNMGTNKGPKTPDERERQARLFRKSNPHIWSTFVDLVRETAEAPGGNKFGVEMIWNVMRWKHHMTGEDGTKFKLNNNYKSFFARWFMEEYPQYGEIFETRDAA